ncbi:hypothetical protein Ahy_A10g048119 [Arachis hypogaea]|uniref:Uncharacterized protein n=1 Tax=Arachis hypogaea TaxID=3818 RepID=A0A445B4A2_ARAHY|nr:hypothetical protein Ahy_A10g048119 [Arachis hypogaea]
MKKGSMTSDGVLSSSRRSGGVGREEQFTEGLGPKGKDGKDGISLKCFCEEHATSSCRRRTETLTDYFSDVRFIRYMRQPHCKFLLWLDEHIARFGLSDARDRREKKFGDVEEHQWKQDMENTIVLEPTD